MQRAIVIGSGGIGLSSAYFLMKSGWQVTVVDRGALGRGCSYGNAGLIVPSHSHPLPGPGTVRQVLRWMFQKSSPFYIRPRLNTDLIRWLWSFQGYCNSRDWQHGFESLLILNRASLELFHDLIRTEEVDFFFRRDGLLHVYVSESGAARANQEAKMLQEAGFPAVQLSKEETLEFEPSLDVGICGGLFIGGEAHGFSSGYLQSLAARLETMGASLVIKQEVSRIIVDHGRAQGIEFDSTHERLFADLVVLAAGSWASRLTASVHLEIPLQPAKGYSCTMDNYDGSPQVPILIPEKRVIITPLGNRLRFGGTLELAGYNLKINENRYQTLVSGASAVLKSPVPIKNEEAWCGLRPLTPDGLPIIDRAPGIDGLIIATGHAMMGFTQAPITGKLVAELADNQQPSVPLAPFRVNRFVAT